MIHVRRSPCPKKLQKEGPVWLKDLRQAKTDCERIKNDPNSTEKEKAEAERSFKAAQGKYNHSTIKRALQTMFNGGVVSKSTKCAYCETAIESPKGQDIEHFYPKAVYLDKTFDWDNLLIACVSCNEEFKGDDFPVDPEGRPLLINPTSEEPADHLSFLFDVETLESHVEGKDEMGRITVDFFALNGFRSTDKKGRSLAAVRQSVVLGWITMALLFQKEADLDKRKDLLEEFQGLCHPKTQYAAFARAIHRAL